MPSTHVSLHVHLVFSTKERRPWIADGWRHRLHAYMGGTVRAVGATPLAIGGTADHVHLLVGVRATHRIADLLREVKGASSRWVHETVAVSGFSWQDGYGAFTISHEHIEGVRQYIGAQAAHHQKLTFQEEYLSFLQRYGVEYDPRYLW